MAEFETEQKFMDELAKLLKKKAKLKEFLREMHHGDVLEILAKPFNEEEKADIFEALPPEVAADVLAEAGDDLREILIEEREPKQIAGIVEEMDSDDAADFLGELPDEQSQKVLAHLPVKDSAEVRSLLQYPEDSAGGIMQLELVALKPKQNCGDAVRTIRAKANEIPELHNVFVTDDDGKLLGVVPLPKFVLNPKDRSIKKIMDYDPKSVNVMADREEVAQVFRKYDVVSLAVVDNEGRLLGRILHDDVLDVITEENTEDVLKTAGTNEAEFDSTSSIQAARSRLPWLLTSLMGGLVMAGIIKGLGAPLEQVIALAAFIPVITGMSGNVSTQSSAVMVRAIVLGRVNSGVSSYIQKEFFVGIMMASFCGSLIGVVAWYFQQNPGIGFVVGLSLFLSMGCASILGTLVPLMLHKAGFDPVLGAGPIVLTAVDMSAIVIYFTLAGTLIHLLL